MVISEVITFFIYAISIVFLPEYFGEFKMLIDPGQKKLTAATDLEFVTSVPFLWKVALIVAVSSLPLYIIKFIRSWVAPASSSKLL